MQLSGLATLLTALSSISIYVDASPAITSPLQVQWKAGTANVITWIDNQDGKSSPDKVNLSLMQGKPTSLQEVGNIATEVDTASGQFIWDIPAAQVPGSDYAIRIGVLPNIFYSPYFEIVVANGNSSKSVPESSSEATSVTSTDISSVESTNSVSETTHATSEAVTTPSGSTISEASKISSTTKTPSNPSSPTNGNTSGSSTNVASFVSALTGVGWVIAQLI
ncbi:hypothetical protein K7432_001276 [Basidiobolus ranarum]|uniref:Yeast cell wall synthesis Kre9/Knh1-like N-terminal domain-containing protein n=1 Tax=Basidiobolus ranarum TaxID=34480 RepID=A0ABR2X3C7_9FUNG